MRTEIIELLKKEGKLSDETLKELSTYDIQDFIDTVKDLGNNQTKYIKKELIQKNLDTEFIGKKIYIFKEVMSTNTVAKFFAESADSNGMVIVSEKQTNARGRSGKAWEFPFRRGLAFNNSNPPNKSKQNTYYNISYRCGC